MSDESARSDGSDRLHALDAVRGFALVLGVFFHATMSFLPGETPMWLISDTQRSTTLAVTFYVLHVFRMTAFFVIAGFFARMMYHRRGLAGFARDRGKRIGIPLVAGWPFVFGAIVAATIAGTLIQYGGPPPFTPPPPPEPPFAAFPLTHLWFLYVLILFYASGLAVRALVARLDATGQLRGLLDGVLGRLVTFGLAPLVLAAPLALALNAHGGWMMWMGIPTPDNSLVPNLPAFVGFGVAFTFGWLLQRQMGLLARLRGQWPLHLAVALAATAAALWQAGLMPTGATDLPGVDRPVYAASYALASWAWTFALIGLALRFLDGFSAWRRYLADASYWIYIVHLPLLILLQGVVAAHPWPWAVKYVLILVVAFAIMLATYQTLVRYTWLGAILNGRRAPRPGARRMARQEA
ncbi:acyltransferase family protein [Phenylobacterium sp.]|uniref:acyltransferase family protein n=1 Tax=Phenylobacterium sp. TaxID=1871053 RepID=UPI00301BC4DA